MVTCSLAWTVLALLFRIASPSAACEQLWQCPSDGPVIPMQRLYYPGDCGKRAAGFRLQRSNQWSRACVLEFLALLFDECGAAAPQPRTRNHSHHHANFSNDCVNLAPAGTGTETLAHCKADTLAHC